MEKDPKLRALLALLVWAVVGFEAIAEEVDANGIRSHRVESVFQGSEAMVRVMLPDDYNANDRYRVLYVLPVVAKDDRRFGDGLLEVKKYNLHNTHRLICVAPEFTEMSWFADHASNPALRDESHFLNVVLPLVDGSYATIARQEGRLLVGFSKSGWGAFSLLLRNPDLFHRATGWDTGIRVDTGPIEESDRQDRIDLIWGTRANFERYRLSALIKTRGKVLGEKARIFYFNTGGRRAEGGAIFHQLMVEQEIPHRYVFEPKIPHRWDSGWIPQAIEFLVGE
jgi:hypothetical protein